MMMMMITLVVVVVVVVVVVAVAVVVVVVACNSVNYLTCVKINSSNRSDQTWQNVHRKSRKLIANAHPGIDSL